MSKRIFSISALGMTYMILLSLPGHSALAAAEPQNCEQLEAQYKSRLQGCNARESVNPAEPSRESCTSQWEKWHAEKVVELKCFPGSRVPSPTPLPSSGSSIYGPRSFSGQRR